VSISLKNLVHIIDKELKPSLFKDYAPNGLQVEGRSEIQKIVTGVTACEQLIDGAITANADAILVHHGYFWRGENPCITGMKKKRLRKLLMNDINLLGYHLPLDAHPTLGNNAELARVLNITIQGGLDQTSTNPIGNIGTLPLAISLEEFGKLVHNKLKRKPLLIEGSDKPIKTIAWCTGGAQDFIDHAIELGVDAFMSGEISERTVHSARESGIHYIAGGHHATERYGIQALGQWLERNHNITHQFIDIPNPA